MGFRELLLSTVPAAMLVVSAGARAQETCDTTCPIAHVNNYQAHSIVNPLPNPGTTNWQGHQKTIWLGWTPILSTGVVALCVYDRGTGITDLIIATNQRNEAIVVGSDGKLPGNLYMCGTSGGDRIYTGLYNNYDFNPPETCEGAEFHELDQNWKTIAVRGLGGNDLIVGRGDSVTGYGGGIEVLCGQDGNDILVAEPRYAWGNGWWQSWMEGGPGNDDIRGWIGLDPSWGAYIKGGSGNDILSWGNHCDGGSGTDSCGGWYCEEKASCEYTF